MTDTTNLKTQIAALTYEEKIELNKWLHENIQTNMASHTKEAMVKLDEKTNSFLDKAKSVLKLKF